MTKKGLIWRRASAQGAVATGARATGSAATGALSVGALAFGALAVGAVAIGRLAIGRARVGRLEIGELVVNRLEIGNREPAPVTAVVHIRAAPGRGDAMERLLLDHVSRNNAGGVMTLPGRSMRDPDLFVLHAQYADRAAFEQPAHLEWLGDIRRHVVEAGLVEGPVNEAVREEFFQTMSPADTRNRKIDPGGQSG